VEFEIHFTQSHTLDISGRVVNLAHSIGGLDDPG